MQLEDLPGPGCCRICARANVLPAVGATWCPDCLVSFQDKPSVMTDMEWAAARARQVAEVRTTANKRPTKRITLSPEQLAKLFSPENEKP